MGGGGGGGGLCFHFQDILDILKMTTVTPFLSSSHTVLVFEKKKKMFYFLRMKVFYPRGMSKNVQLMFM